MSRKVEIIEKHNLSLFDIQEVELESIETLIKTEEWLKQKDETGSFKMTLAKAINAFIFVSVFYNDTLSTQELFSLNSNSDEPQKDINQLEKKALLESIENITILAEESPQIPFFILTTLKVIKDVIKNNLKRRSLNTEAAIMLLPITNSTDFFNLDTNNEKTKPIPELNDILDVA